MQYQHKKQPWDLLHTADSLLLFVFISKFCLMLLYQSLLYVVRNKLVTCELRGKRSTSACNRAQRDRIVCKFLQRYLGLQFLITGFAVHTHDEGTTSLQVAHDITHKVGRNINLKVVNRLKNLRTSILKCIREGMAGSQHNDSSLLSTGCIFPS